MSGPPARKGSEQSLWRNLTLVLVLAALAGLFLLRPSRAHPGTSAGQGGGSINATPTPIPWDDIQVSDQDDEPAFITNEALAVAGRNVYVLYNQIGVRFARSIDGGHTFLPSVLIAGAGISPALTRREGAPPEEMDLYVVFDTGRPVWFTRSPDGGSTWMQPVIVYDGTADDTWPGVPKIAVDAAGTIYATWHHDTNEYSGYYYLSRSTDGGSTWSAPLAIIPEPYSRMNRAEVCSLVVQGGTLYFGWVGRRVPPGNLPREVMFTQSTDQGQTWSEPVRVDDAVEDTVGETMDLAVDPAGVIYAVWSDTRLFGGSHALTYVARSTDGGNTWSPGVRVDDAGDCVQSSSSASLAVDGGTGSLHVALSDGRNYCQEPYYLGWHDTFYTYSTDGGLTWSPNEQISNPVPYNYAGPASLQMWAGVAYTTFDGGLVGPVPPRIWLDIHDPGLPPVTPTPTPTPSVTPTPTASPSPTDTPTPAPTGSPTSTPVIEPTETATPSPGFTETATPSPSPTPTGTAAPTPTPTVTPTMSPTAAVTPTPYPTPEEWRVYLPWIETWVELGD